MPYVKYKSREGSKSAFKLAVDIFLRMLAAGFMCAIVYVSMTSVFLAFGSEVTGYTVQERDSEGNYQVTEKVVFEGEDKTVPEVDAQTTRITLTKELTSGAKTVCGITSQIIMLALFCVLLYTEIWSCGDSDRNLVKHGRISENKYKGLASGAIACIPYGISWVVVSLCNFKVIPFSINNTFSFANIAFKPFIDAMLKSFAWYDALLLLAPALLVIVYCQAVYLIGYNQIFVSEKILYTDK